MDKGATIAIKIEKNLLLVNVDKDRLYSESAFVFLLWMIFASLILLFFSYFFMNKQLRPLKRLAIIAETFGRGLEAPELKSTGASEIRHLGYGARRAAGTCIVAGWTSSSCWTWSSWFSYALKLACEFGHFGIGCTDQYGVPGSSSKPYTIILEWIDCCTDQVEQAALPQSPYIACQCHEVRGIFAVTVALKTRSGKRPAKIGNSKLLRHFKRNKGPNLILPAQQLYPHCPGSAAYSGPKEIICFTYSDS